MQYVVDIKEATTFEEALKSSELRKSTREEIHIVPRYQDDTKVLEISRDDDKEQIKLVLSGRVMN